MGRYWVPMWVVECGVQREGCISMVKHDDAQRALDAERHSKQCDMETLTLKFTSQLASLQARCAHLDVLLRDEYLPKLDVVAVQRSIADRDSRIDALEREVEKLDDDKETLQAQLADRDAMILQMGEQAAVLAKENMAVKAQLRQVEGQSQQQAEEAVIVFAKYTTLQQLVEALINSDTAKDHDKAWFALRATLAAQDAPLTKEQRRIEDCCEKPHDCKWGGIGGCGYDGRKHELRQVAPPHGGTP